MLPSNVEERAGVFGLHPVCEPQKHVFDGKKDKMRCEKGKNVPFGLFLKAFKVSE